MILSDKDIRRSMFMKQIVIEPFRPECLGSNSYDVHLGDTLAFYERSAVGNTGSDGAGVTVLDAKKEHPITYIPLPEEGLVLLPGILYLGSTEEYTETHDLVPWIDGKSSVGRLGINIHATAGRGDAGFCNHWTLEIYCVQPVRVYKGMPIGQLTYFETGKIDIPYNKKKSAKYSGVSPLPVASAMWKNFNKDTGKWE